MNSDWAATASTAVTDVYTNLHGLQNLKVEKNDEVALKKVAQQFESMFINMLLKNMRAANQVFSEGNMFDSQESEFYRDMHDNQLALTMAHTSGFGIADAMYRQLSQRYGQGDQPLQRAVQVDPSVKSRVDKEKAAASENKGSAMQFTQIPFADKGKAPTDQNSTPTDFVSGLLADFSAKASEFSSGSDGVVSDRSSIANSPMEFVSRVLPSAEKTAEQLGVDKEILIAQAALETGWGSKVFANEEGASTFNLFNIKADQRWQGDRVAKASLEFLGGRFTQIASQFRAYENVQASFQDFSDFLKSNQRYQGALESAGDSLEFIRNIHQAGYATDPAYVSKIESVYHRVKEMLASTDDAGVQQ